MNNPSPPKGLLEELFIQRLLNKFIDMLERQQSRLSIKISPKSTPELFEFEKQDPVYLWMLIESLEKEYGVLKIKLAKRNLSQEVYDGATLTFHREAEDEVRIWLGRPVALSKQEKWQEALRKNAHLFTTEQYALLKEKPIAHHSRDSEYIIAALLRVSEVLKASVDPLSLRTLSARCFDGDSKCLDQRTELLKQLFPEQFRKIKPRSLLLSVALPQEIKQVLFIENQDTFLECIAGHHHPLINTSVLVYSAGFRGAAERARDPDCIRFAFIGEKDTGVKNIFEQWWATDKPVWPCYFWGDLDYSGMSILASLHTAFPMLSAWKPGYDALLNYHQRGLGHGLVDAKKEKQKVPLQTGCSYADNTLLPLMISTRRFLDQETVSLDDLSH